MGTIVLNLVNWPLITCGLWNSVSAAFSSRRGTTITYYRGWNYFLFRDLLYFRLVASMFERLLSVGSPFLWWTSCPAFTFPSFLSVSRAAFLPAISLRCLFCSSVWSSYLPYP